MDVMLGEFVFIVIALFFISWLWFIVSDLSKEKDNQQREFAAKAKVEAKAKAYAIAEQEAFQKSELEADRIAELEREEIRQAEEVAEENFTLNLSALKTNLPFYTSNRTPSAELADHDKNMWDDVIDLIKNEDGEKTTLYFVKLKSLMDDQEYFKIGITTKGVVMRFKKSTQLELIEIIAVFDTEKWKAAFLEYHFLREFRLYDGLSTSIGEQRPEVGFSGYTEVVRSNSVNKISEYFGELDVYNKLK
jgi:hypothetical protein